MAINPHPHDSFKPNTTTPPAPGDALKDMGPAPSGYNTGRLGAAAVDVPPPVPGSYQF